ncbi:DUF2071 domain-containing protein [Streptomyces sp. RB17]|nr:DUF2071 domain-containing protein [Streptomyces sp. RB17]
MRRLLPGGLVVDTCEGAAWVSLTPFPMAAVPPGPVARGVARIRHD